MKTRIIAESIDVAADAAAASWTAVSLSPRLANDVASASYLEITQREIMGT